MDKEFETKLILEIESHRCLYDKTCVDYKDRYKKARSWEEIALVLGKSVGDCQRKWTNLRDTFRVYFKAESSAPSGSAAVRKVTWIHFEELKFLIPFIKTPSTIGNFASQGCSFLADEIVTNITAGDMVDVVLDHGESAQTRAKRAKRTDNDENLKKILHAMEKETAPSAMDNFFMSLAKQSEGLTRKQQLNLQKKCLQVLEDVEMDLCN